MRIMGVRAVCGNDLGDATNSSRVVIRYEAKASKNGAHEPLRSSSKLMPSGRTEANRKRGDYHLSADAGQQSAL